MNRYSGTDFCVDAVCNSSTYGVRWIPGSGEVGVVNPVDLLPKGFKAIGFRFAQAAQAVGFFEHGRVAMRSLISIYRLPAWWTLLRGMLATQKEMRIQGWESLDEEQLLSKSLLLLQAAVYGIDGLVRVEPIAGRFLHGMADGSIALRIGDNPHIHALIRISETGLQWQESCEAADGGRHRVDFRFKDAQTFWKIAAGLADNLAAVGRGDVVIRGYLPLADGFNHLLDRLQMYVKNQ